MRAVCRCLHDPLAHHVARAQSDGIGVDQGAFTYIALAVDVHYVVAGGLQQPLLGICLGMQMLTAHSMEGDVACLNLIPSEVLPMQSAGLRLPHMGWNTLHSISEHPLMRGFSVTDYVYFVHSFAVAPGPHSLALCHYGSDFAAVIGKDNVAGAQFHPERSGKTGARLLQNFLEWQL